MQLMYGDTKVVISFHSETYINMLTMKVKEET
jgi:hypothetical protein